MSKAAAEKKKLFLFSTDPWLQVSKGFDATVLAKYLGCGGINATGPENTDKYCLRQGHERTLLRCLGYGFV
jgi:hypothetical protein